MDSQEELVTRLNKWLLDFQNNYYVIKVIYEKEGRIERSVRRAEVLNRVIQDAWFFPQGFYPFIQNTIRHNIQDVIFDPLASILSLHIFEGRISIQPVHIQFECPYCQAEPFAEDILKVLPGCQSKEIWKYVGWKTCSHEISIEGLLQRYGDKAIGEIAFILGKSWDAVLRQGVHDRKIIEKNLFLVDFFPEHQPKKNETPILRYFLANHPFDALIALIREHGCFQLRGGALQLQILKKNLPDDDTVYDYLHNILKVSSNDFEKYEVERIDRIEAFEALLSLDKN